MLAEKIFPVLAGSIRSILISEGVGETGAEIRTRRTADGRTKERGTLYHGLFTSQRNTFNQAELGRSERSFLFHSGLFIGRMWDKQGGYAVD